MAFINTNVFIIKNQERLNFRRLSAGDAHLLQAFFINAAEIHFLYERPFNIVISK